MKQLNEYRRTEHFNLTSVVLDHIVAVREYVKNDLKETLIAIVPTPNEHGETFDRFTVRTTGERYGVYDHLIESSTSSCCKTLETKVICSPLGDCQ